MNPTRILCIMSALMPLVAAGIEVTDEWSYHTTNAQTVIGALGVLSMSANFISAWYFYRKTQQDLANLLQQRLDELNKLNDDYQKWDKHLIYSNDQTIKYITEKQGSPCDCIRATKNISD